MYIERVDILYSDDLPDQSLMRSVIFTLFIDEDFRFTFWNEQSLFWLCYNWSQPKPDGAQVRLFHIYHIRTIQKPNGEENQRQPIETIRRPREAQITV